MAVSCDKNDLAESAKCYACLPERMMDAALIYLLCTWSHGGITPEEQIVLGDPELDFMFGDPTSDFVFGN